MRNINRFILSPFSPNEKRNIFCHTCRKPFIKARIDTDNLNNYHQSLIYRSQQVSHVCAPNAPGITRAEFNAL